jgi:A/G-specific adenine glycosylase
MALLRDALAPAPADAVAAVWPEDAQRDRCLASLLVDGLVEALPGPGGADDVDGVRYRLPA